MKNESREKRIGRLWGNLARINRVELKNQANWCRFAFISATHFVKG
jgi:hypothetical protein